jgi:hypothetical protein
LEAEVAEVEAADAAEAEAVEMEAIEVEAAEAAEAEGCIRGSGMHRRQRHASEAAACIGSIGMHQKSMEADRADRADRASGEYKVSEAVKVVRTCQNSLGQDGTCLGLLLLHVGPNGDGFGGQAFMEHYTGIFSRGSPMMLQMMWNPSGSCVAIGWILSSTFLYFLLYTTPGFFSPIGL